MPLPGNQKRRNLEIFLVAGTQRRPNIVRQYRQSLSQDVANWAVCSTTIFISFTKQEAAFLIKPAKRSNYLSPDCLDVMYL